MSAALEKPWPVCAVCNKPVDELLDWYDHDAQRHWFGVKCHGAFEKSYLNRKELEQFRDGTFTFCAAFATKELALLAEKEIVMKALAIPTEGTESE